jgi:hypothetical protein
LGAEGDERLERVGREKGEWRRECLLGERGLAGASLGSTRGGGVPKSLSLTASTEQDTNGEKKDSGWCSFGGIRG